MKPKERPIEKLLFKYIKKEENLFLCEKIFIANSFMVWIEENSKNNEQRESYTKEIIRFLEGEIDLYWENAKIKIKKVRKS